MIVIIILIKIILKNNHINDSDTVVGDYINAMKATFDLNFYLYQGFKRREYTTK